MATRGNRSGSLQDGAIVPSDLFTSQKGTLLLIHPMLAILGNRSGSLQDGAIVPSDLLTSQNGIPFLVHPILHPNISSPRDAATLGEIGSAFPATHISPLQSVFFVWFSHLPSMVGGGMGCIVVTNKISSSVAKHPDCHCWYR